jgi:hypothetical protein
VKSIEKVTVAHRLLQKSVLEFDSRKPKNRKEQSTTPPQPQIVQNGEDEEDLEGGAFFLGENDMGKDDWPFK